MLKLLALTAMFAGLVTAQADFRTSGFYNGRFWNGASESIKIGMVVGFQEGLAVAENEKATHTYYGTSVVPGERIKGLDQFYADPANLAIPIIWAHEILTARVNGAEPDDIAERVAAYRRLAKELNDHPAKPAAGLAKQ